MRDVEEINTKEDDIEQLAGLFDLLARFDFEDKRKEVSKIGTDSLVSAPKESVLISDI